MPALAPKSLVVCLTALAVRLVGPRRTCPPASSGPGAANALTLVARTVPAGTMWHVGLRPAGITKRHPSRLTSLSQSSARRHRAHCCEHRTWVQRAQLDVRLASVLAKRSLNLQMPSYLDPLTEHGPISRLSWMLAPQLTITGSLPVRSLPRMTKNIKALNMAMAGAVHTARGIGRHARQPNWAFDPKTLINCLSRRP